MKLFAGAVMGFALIAFSPFVSAQTVTTTYNDADSANNPGSWTDDSNWSALSPVTLSSDGDTVNVHIGKVPSSASSNDIILDLGGGTGTIASLTFDAAGAGTGGTPGLSGTVSIIPAATDSLIVTGNITNNSLFNQNIEPQTLIAGGNATYAGSAGGAGGQLSIGTLNLKTFTIATTGTVNVVDEIFSTISSATTYGKIGAINGAGITLSVSNFNTSYTGNTGDFFQIATGNLAGATANVTDAPLTGTETWIQTLVGKGIFFVEPTAGTTVINAGVVLPIGNDTEFNTGGIVFNGGELLTSNESAGDSDTSGGVQSPGGTNITIGTAFSTGRTITINTGTAATIAATTGTTATYTSTAVISDSGGTPGTLTIGDSSNTGTVVFGAANTYAGATAITSGATLKLANANAVQNSTVTVNAANGITFGTGIGTFLVGGLAGAGNETLADTGSTAVTLQVGNNNSTSTYSGVLSGTGGAFTKVGTGTETLSGASTYTGATSVTGGALKAGIATVAGTSGAFGVNSAVTVGASGTLDIAGFATQIGSLAGSGSVTDSGAAATLTTGASNTSTTFSGTVSGALALTKIGTGTATLAHANTYTGATTVTTGTLQTTASNAIASGNAVTTGASGILDIAGTTETLGALTNGGNVTSSLAGGSLTIGSGSGGAGTLTGTMNVNLAASAAGAISVASANNAGTLTNSGTGAGTSTVTTVGANVTSVTQASSTSALTVTSLSVNSAGTTLASTGTSPLTVTNAVTGTGNLVLNANSTGSISVGGATNTGSVTNSGTSTGTTTIAGVINTNVSGVVENSTGSKLVLSGANTYTSATTVTAGTLTAGVASVANTSGAFGDNSALTVGAAGTADISGFATQIGSLAGSGAVTDSGAAATLTTGANNTSTTFSGAISSGLALSKIGTGTQTLSGTNTYTGATTIGGGELIVSGSTAAGSAVALNAGTLDVTGKVGGTVAVANGATLTGAGNGTTTGVTGAVTVASGGNINLTTDSAIGTLTVGNLSLTGSALSFEIGGGTTATDKIAAGTLTIGSGTTTINIANLGGTSQSLTLGTYTLLSYTNGSLPANLGNLQLNTTTLDNETLSLVTSNVGLVQLQVTGNASQTFTNPAPNPINIITGSTTTVTATLNNNNTGGGASVAVNLANNGGTGGTVTGLTATGGATSVSPNSSTTVSGTFTAGTVGSGETWSIKNTDTNQMPANTITTGGVANVFNHATGTLTVTSPTTVSAITGTTVNSTLTFLNNGANNVAVTILTPGTGVTGLSGSFAGNAQVTTVNGATTAGAAGTATTATYSTTYQENQSVIGANTATLTATAGTVTIDNFNHANGVLGVTSATTVNAIAGTTINSTLSFTNSGAHNDNLAAGTAGGGLTAATGTFTANQSTTLNGSFAAGAAGTSATHNFTQNYTEDQTVLGATTGTQTATAGVLVNSFTHAAGVLTVTSPTTVKAITGATVNSTLTFANNGATNDNLSAGTAGGGLIAATGTFIANQSTTLNGSFTAGAAGTTTTNNFTQTWLEDQSVLGATTGNQTSTAGVSVTAYNHATGVLAVTSPTTVKAIAGATVSSTLTFTNSGANNDNLTAGTAGGGLIAATGTFIANQATTLTGSFTAGAAGTMATNTFTQQYLEDQTVIGATTGNQTASAGVTVDSFSHAVGTLAVTSATTVNAIAGTTINSTLSFTNTGATNDNLIAGTAGGGLTAATGTLTASQTQALTGSFTAGTAGTSATHNFTQNFTEDQTVIGATTGTQTSTAGVTVDSFSHAVGVLAVTSPTTLRAITGTTINSTLTFTNSGATNDNLIAGTAGGGLTAATGTFIANQSTTLSGSFTAGAAGTTTTNTFTQQYHEDQTVLGATTGNQTASAGVSVTALGHSAPCLSTMTDAFGFVHAGGTVANATTTLSNGAGNLAGLQIVSLGGLTDSGSGLIAAGTGRSLSATVNTTTAGAYSNVYTIQTEDDQTVVGATANGNLTFTVSGNIYSGQGVWNTNGGGTWGAIATPTNWTALGGAPGLDSNFTTTDSATFGAALTAGTATVTLNGDSPSLNAVTFNDAAGSYTIAQGSGGTLKLNAGSGTAAIADMAGSHAISAPVELDSNTVIGAQTAGNVLTLSGAISGAGTSAVTFGGGGAGTVLLSGANTFTGISTLTSGILKLGSTNALTSSSTVTQTGGTLDIDGNAQTLNNFSSTGGTITNTSGTAVTVTFDESADPVNASNITGNVAVDKTGVGLLDLTGNNTYTGGTTVTAGTLEAGSGTAFGTGAVAVNGGVLSTDGNEHVINVGTGASTANYTQAAGGTLALTLRGAPDANGLNAVNDILDVTGTASLAGSLALNIVPSGSFTPAKGQVFEIIATNLNTPGNMNGITGTFGSTTVTPPGFIIHTTTVILPGDVVPADSTGNKEYVVIDSTQLALSTIPGAVFTPNQTNIANYLSASVTSGPLFTIISNAIATNPLSAPSLVAQFNPEVSANFNRSTTFNNVAFTLQELDGYFESQRSAKGDFLAGNGQLDSSALTVVDPSMDPALAQVSSRLLAWSPAPFSHGLLSDSTDPVLAGVEAKDMKETPTESPTGDPFNTFVVGNVVLAQNFSQPNLNHSDTSTGGVQLGADYRVTPHLRAGVLFGYNHTDGTLDNNGSSATIESYAPGAYVSFADHGWYANAVGSYGFDNFTEDRQISLPGASAIAHGAPSGDQVTGNLDGGYDFHAKNWTFGPMAGVEYTHLDVDSYTEDGAGAFNSDLAVNKQKADSLRSRVGGHVNYVYQTGKVLLTPHLDASWQHEFMDQSTSLSANLVSFGGTPFTITTPHPSRDSVLLDAGLDAQVNGQISVFGDYLVQAGQSNYFGQSVQAGVKIGF